MWRSCLPELVSPTFLKIVVDVPNLGLPQICKLWIGVGKDILPVRHLAPRILNELNYCGRQLARRLGWAAPAFHKEKDATPHPGTCKHSLQYDGRSDGPLGVRVGTWNLVSLSGMGENCVRN